MLVEENVITDENADATTDELVIDEAAGEEELDEYEKKLNLDPEGQIVEQKKAVQDDAQKIGEEKKAADDEEAEKIAAKEAEEKKEQAKEKRFKDTQRSFHDERKKRIEAEKDLIKQKIASHQELSTEELADLKEADVDAYADYKIAQAAKPDSEAQLKEKDDEIAAFDQEEMNVFIAENTYAFVSKITGEKIDGIPEKFDDLPEKVKEFMKSDEYQQVASFVDKTFIKEGMRADSDLMEAVYFKFNKDKILSEVTSKAEADSAEAIAARVKKAAESTSPLDRQQATSAKDRSEKGFENWTQTDLDGAGEKELDEYEKWHKERRK